MITGEETTKQIKHFCKKNACVHRKWNEYSLYIASDQVLPPNEFLKNVWFGVLELRRRTRELEEYVRSFSVSEVSSSNWPTGGCGYSKPILCSYTARCKIFMHLFETTHVCVLIAQLCPTLCGSMNCSPPGFSVHGILRQEYWSGLLFPPPRGLPNPEIKPASPLAPAL